MFQISLVQGQKYIDRCNLPNRVEGTNRLQFTIGKMLMEGGNGAIYRGKCLSEMADASSACAIKILKQQTETSHDRFQNEIRILGELDHPNISKLYSSGQMALTGAKGSYEVPWCAIDLGYRNMKYHVEQEGPLNIDRLAFFWAKACDALGYMHSKNIIHRDIKPANFIWLDQALSEVKMIDFGIAKYLYEDVSPRPLDNFTRTNEFVGPVFFSSPELIAYSNDKSTLVDYRSDYFQLGKTLWYLATSKVSAGVPSLRDCPAGGKLRHLVIQVIDDDPGSRPQTIDEMKSLMGPVIIESRA